MADIRNTAAFKALAVQTSAELLTRGLDVVPVAVHNVLAHTVTMVADRMGIQPRSALRYIEPSVIADQIAKAGGPGAEGGEGAHGVRPVRIDAREVSLPRWVCSRPLMALSQAVKYAANNGDSRTVQHALDLIFELGLAIGADPDDNSVDIPVSVLDEAAQLIEHVASRIETGGWSLCPCGEDHGQGQVDAKVPETLRADAELARKMRARADS
ncbi:hypothetical protein [Streptomyces antarcticus]|uniref:hypothetical protein n=1 Tax=Streptomyces antarcticus TaxID=2996458 RepID=UPI0022703B87|nr:hypothetical protein [Streptomyces sp. H34-AA3]MCY0945682.1 hypothetical protein [Streptomyces sp. H34-AA3]